VIQASTRIRFCAAHRLTKHHGPCDRLHGHNYSVTVVLEGKVQEDGMVSCFDEGFGGIREWIDETIDHRFIASPAEDQALLAADPNHIICPTGEPSAENIAIWIGELFAPQFTKVRLVSIKVWETDLDWAMWSNDK